MGDRGTEIRLVADIGGTNTRIALFDTQTGEFRGLQEFLNRDFAGLGEAIEAWLATLDETPPDRACIAAAAYQSGDHLRMVNCNWSFSRRQLQERFGWRSAGWLNDFEANAHALPWLGAENSQPLQAGNTANPGRLAVVGPGTGFGGASLLQAGGRAVACSAEPGHMGLSPASDLELAVFEYLLRDHPDIFVELLVSGPGLCRLHQALCALEGLPAEPLQPADISTRALQGSDPSCSRALGLFCSLFGSACGDFILASGAWGGLYIAGGISLKIMDFLQQSEFLPRLRAKGAMGEHLAGVPVWMITASHPGLIGAAHAPI
ncbi:glucokinase [Haliea sp. E17]|uniref:glucokinase n=1 Tax=Haliea sp. E17 TaxID=3401576 RepID=UPI003AACF5C1